MRTIAVVNQKGGAGKTTSAVNLAAALGEAGASVLVVDLDPQASATAWFGLEGGRAMLDVFTGDDTLDGVARKAEAAPGVEVAPSSTWLAGVERAVGAQPGAELILARALRRVRPRDYVLVDCPPSLGLLAVSGLAAAREALVPVATHAMELAGLAALTQTLDLVAERLNPGLRLSAVLACRANRTVLSRDVQAALRERFGPLVLDVVVRENVRLAEAPSYAQPITAYAPASTGAADYRAAAAELARRSTP